MRFPTVRDVRPSSNEATTDTFRRRRRPILLRPPSKVTGFRVLTPRVALWTYAHPLVSDVRLVLRGLWSRRGVAAAVLVISALVVGGAVTGPVFLRAAGESVLQDTLRESAPVGRLIELVQNPPSVSTDFGSWQRWLDGRLAQVPTLQRLTGTAIHGVEAHTVVNRPGETATTIDLVYRDNVCAQLRLVAGRCPSGPDGVMASSADVRLQGWQVGERLEVGGKASRLVGVYAPRDTYGDYWGNRHYFLTQEGADGLDALFGTQGALQRLDPSTASTKIIDLPVRWQDVRVADSAALERQTLRFTGKIAFGDTALPAVLVQAQQVRDRLDVPVLVVEAQLLLLCWLVLYLVAANAAEARGPEIALAKLRGVPAARTVAFGLADTVLLVALAAPLGLGLALLWVHGLAYVQLAPDTPVVLTRGAYLAALAATAGAAAAASLAAVRTLRRPVVEQWRRATRGVRARSWAVDAVVVAAAVAGLVILARSGTFSGGHTSVMALVAPGLVVLAMALVGSRALPALCRSAYQSTRDAGRIGRFLAVRQVGRRPITLRLGLVLAVAFGLVTFAVDAWSVSRTNQHDRAWTEVGAARVLSVQTDGHTDLGAVVDRLDPTGRQAAAVDVAVDYTSGSPPRKVVAVQSERFAHVAYWRSDFTAESLAALAKELQPAAAPPVVVSGDRITVRVSVHDLHAQQPPALVARIAVPGSSAYSVTLGALHDGTEELSGDVTCADLPCRLVSLGVQRPGVDFYPMSGELTVTSLLVHDRHGWHDIGGDLHQAHGWLVTDRSQGDVQATSGSTGLVVRFRAGDSDEPEVRPADRPVVLPVVATRSIAATTGPTTVHGLDGRTPLPVDVVSTAAALPYAGSSGLLVDRTYALRAAEGRESASEQVWLAPSAPASFAASLEKAGVAVLGEQSAAERETLLSRQGPALAILLFLAGAGLGAVLAAGGAVLNLHLSGRRRSYELAAMTALGVPRRALRTSLYGEQGVLLLFGVASGVVAGVAGALLALPSVPQFADVPTAPPLLFGVHAGPVLGLVGVAVLVLGVAVVASAVSLLRTAEMDQLREAPV